jgi:YggT family protein
LIILAYFLNAVAEILGMILWLMNILVIAYVVCSWLNADPYNTLVRIIYSSVQPMIQFFRTRITSKLGGWTAYGIILIIFFLQLFLVPLLKYYAGELSRF